MLKALDIGFAMTVQLFISNRKCVMGTQFKFSIQKKVYFYDLCIGFKKNQTKSIPLFYKLRNYKSIKIILSVVKIN